MLSVGVIDYTADDNHDDDDDNDDDDDDDDVDDDVDDEVDDRGEVDDGWLSVGVIGHRPSPPSVLPPLTCHCLLPFQLFLAPGIFLVALSSFSHCCLLPFQLCLVTVRNI